jgi:phosphoribosylamine--glycine ligase
MTANPGPFQGEKLKILVVGSGAREHALAWKLAQSPRAASVKVAPGNAGIAHDTVPLEASDHDDLVAYARAENIGLVVIGPEEPLARGLADKMEAAGLRVFGPRAAAARLESSKVFAKDFMIRQGIPTAAFRVFSASAEALAHIEGRPEGPVVVKASGLAAGKGVIMAVDLAEAAGAVRAMMDEGRFGPAGREVVIEDFIEGEEVSVLAFSDGRTLRAMPAVQDHKRIGEGDTGPNTGGMGAYCPVAAYTPQVALRVEETIMRPTMEGLAAAGLDFRGCLYFGLMLPAPGSAYEGPQVVEYNARFGDPETQVLMPLLKSDLVEIMLSCVEGRLEGAKIEWREESSACVVIASGGYPGTYQTGLVVTEDVPGPTGASLAFHAGTALNAERQVVTAGGRVISVAARALTLEKALAKAYERVRIIHFQGAYHRRDIGDRELARLKPGLPDSK